MGRRGKGTTGLLVAASPRPSPPSPSPAPKLPRPRAVSLAARSSFEGAGAAVDEKKRVARMRSKLVPPKTPKMGYFGRFEGYRKWHFR